MESGEGMEMKRIESKGELKRRRCFAAAYATIIAIDAIATLYFLGGDSAQKVAVKGFLVYGVAAFITMMLVPGEIE